MTRRRASEEGKFQILSLREKGRENSQGRSIGVSDVVAQNAFQPSGIICNECNNFLNMQLRSITFNV